MAEEKKSEGSTALLNRGKRHFDVIAQGKPSRHSPNATMVYTADEATKLSGYPELVDISKLPGQVDSRKLKADNEQLKKDKEALEAQLAALKAPKEEAPEAPEPEEGRRKRKGE